MSKATGLECPLAHPLLHSQTSRNLTSDDFDYLTGVANRLGLILGCENESSNLSLLRIHRALLDILQDQKISAHESADFEKSAVVPEPMQSTRRANSSNWPMIGEYVRTRSTSWPKIFEYLKS